MSSVIISGDSSGTITLQAPAVSGSTTINLPATSGTATVMPTDYTLGAGNTSSFKNRIINGDMRIDQRNAGASITPTDGQFSADRWKNGLTAASKYSVQQVTDAPSGFSNSLKFTSLSAYTLLSSSEFEIFQPIEGFNFADMAWGTANAKSVTVSFWVKSSLTGLFGGSVANGSNYSCPFSYTINSANTWEYKSYTIPGPTAGTWAGATNGTYLQLFFSLGAGSSNIGTAGTWVSNFFKGATGQTNIVATNGATLYITGVQLEVGSTATSFDYRDYGRELFMCQRYYEKLGWTQSQAPGTVGGYTGALLSLPTAASGNFSGLSWQVPKRDTPTLTAYGSISNAVETANVVIDWNFGTSLGAPSFQRAGLTNFNYLVASASSYGAMYRLVVSAEL